MFIYLLIYLLTLVEETLTCSIFMLFSCYSEYYRDVYIYRANKKVSCALFYETSYWFRRPLMLFSTYYMMQSRV